MVKRQPYLRAFPGYVAFPGGKIDPGDVRPGIVHPMLSAHSDRHLAALHRELWEELGYSLEESLENDAVHEIDLFGTAVTPAFEPVRFNAHYYKIVLAHKPEFRLDQNEIAEGYWQKASRLSDQYRRGRALMVVPMRNTLFALAEDISAKRTDAFNLEVAQESLPVLELIDGLRTIPVPSNTLPPATTTNALCLGDPGAACILVDPSPRSDAVYLQLLDTLRELGPDAILITHHHPDHHERAMRLAREMNLPVMLTAQTRVNLETGYGQEYTRGVALQAISEGQEITRWKGEAVRVYELPGHDDGMVGLAPDDLAWFFVSDLAQSNGSILIPEKGGDLVAYMRSLQRVIDLEPEVVLPSHGIPSGGTVLLERTLAHREEREAQIRPWYERGAGRRTILEEVYPELDPSLHVLALQTIDQHLKKLRMENG